MSKVSYSSSGVNYDNLDKIKRLAQTSALETSKNLESSGFKALDQSRGETAFVWDEGDSYKALVIESLGTKSAIAEEVLLKSGKSYFAEIAQDTVAMIVNDLIVVGAKPLVVNAYFGLGNSDWLLEKDKGADLIKGFAAACDVSGAVWGGGEMVVANKDGLKTYNLVKGERKLILKDVFDLQKMPRIGQANHVLSIYHQLTKPWQE